MGNVVSVKISKDKDSFQAKAKVVYSLVGMGMGLAFVAADPEQVKVFQRWILELSGQNHLSAEPEEGAANSAAASSGPGNGPTQSGTSEPQLF